MSLSIEQIISLCQSTYDHAMYTAGPDGRDGASVYDLSDAIVLCPRGTLANGDFPSTLGWLNDFRSRLVRDPRFPGRVHLGFRNSFDNLLAPVVPALKHAGLNVEQLPPPSPQPEPWYRRLLNRLAGPQILMGEALVSPGPEKPFYIIGHSLGGAVAGLFGEYLQHLNPEVVTLAAPMWCDLELAANFSTHVKVTAYQSKDDLVPWLPPWGFEPIGTPVYERDFSLYSDPAQQWRARHKFYQRLMLDLLDPLTAKATWERIHVAHTLEDGYRPWLVPTSPRGKPSVEAA